MKYSEIFKEARRLHEMGLAIHWLHARSKRPVEAGWTSGPRKTWKYLSETYQPGLNLGVRLGEPSCLEGGYLAVVDVDVKSTNPDHRKEAYRAVGNLIGHVSCPSVNSGRGNGSRHYYYLTPEPFKTWNPAVSAEMVRVKMPSKKPSKGELKVLTPEEIEAGWRMSHAWEISLYSDGRQIVLPPSVHPDSGELYSWKHRLGGVDDLPRLNLGVVGNPEGTVRGKLNPFDGVGGHGPGGLANLDGGKGPGSVREANGAPKGAPDGRVRATVGATQEKPEPEWDFKLEPVDLGWLPISDEVRDAIQDGKGVTDRSGYLLKASSALISAGLSQNEVLTVLTDPDTFIGACSYDHAKTKDRARAARWVYRYTVKRVASERSAAGVFTKASEIPKARKLTKAEQEEIAEEFEEEWNWRQDLNKTSHGGVKVTLKNIDLIFTNAVDGNVFVEDLFASRIEYGTNTPWGGEAKTYIKDIDMIRIKRWMADTEFGIEPATNAVLEATMLVADRCRVHPVREWLSGLEWDGVKRVDTWIRDFCQGVAPEPYLSEVSRKFLLAMVKRVFEPGCQWDYVLVLEGLQGRLKSSAARALAGDKWFMDNLPDLKDKDSMLNLQGKWLIELGELANVKRTDFNQVKAYLVRRTDTVRPHYGRLMADVPRQSVFIGTVNEGQYLKDPTGNRRYWPVRVGTCDVKALSAARDQLFAEAMHIYKTTGEILMLGPDATMQATEAQEDRRIDDDETEMREALEEFRESAIGREFDFSKFRVRDLISGHAAPWAKWGDKPYANQVAAQVLRNLGFERRKVMGQRLWGAPENLGADLGADLGAEVGSAPTFEDDLDFR